MQMKLQSLNIAHQVRAIPGAASAEGGGEEAAGGGSTTKIEGEGKNKTMPFTC